MPDLLNDLAKAWRNDIQQGAPKLAIIDNIDGTKYDVILVGTDTVVKNIRSSTPETLSIGDVVRISYIVGQSGEMEITGKSSLKI